jgi:queuosine precursor transporter
VLGFYVPAGILAYSLTFLITDVIGEAWDKQYSKNIILGGFISLFFVLLLVQLAIFWPSAPFWNNQTSFENVLNLNSRIILGSFVAYLISQYNDIWLFHLLKKITKGKHLWLRNNISTTVSQFIDSVIFIIIAFYGIFPVWDLILGQWIIKIFIAVLDTPIVYLLVHLIQKRIDK